MDQNIGGIGVAGGSGVYVLLGVIEGVKTFEYLLRVYSRAQGFSRNVYAVVILHILA